VALGDAAGCEEDPDHRHGHDREADHAERRITTDPPRDEVGHSDRDDSQATRFAGNVLLVAVLISFVVKIARGLDGAPYAQLGAIAGISYLVALAYLRVRR
jgi:hypothetical protein